MLYMGIDVGTQGVRCLVVDEAGRPVASKSVPFSRLNIAQREGWQEQSPADWQGAMEEAVRACTARLRADGHGPDAVVAISVDGTSGTIVPLDAAHRPLTNGIMYNDPRAREQAAKVRAAMGAYERKLGYAFGASFSLPRILWILENRPEVYEQTAVFAHQADYITGLLCGEFAVSDYSNALKTGYDLLDGGWPNDTTPYIKLIFKNVRQFDREKGFSLRPKLNKWGDLRTGCTYLYDELYRTENGYEVHMMFWTRKALRYLTICSEDIEFEDNIPLDAIP